jgi:uncharacterized protein
MIKRTISAQLEHYTKKYPVVTLTGPRQSGKTTLLRNLFPDYQYVSLEEPDRLLFAKEDPRLFLQNYPEKVIIDEAQRFPELFSYIQTHVDLVGKEGMFILSGSHNFLLMESVSQTLAGRTAILKLLPLSLKELQNQQFTIPDSHIFTGFYPRIFDKNLTPGEFYPFYLQTYVERDIRQIKNIPDLDLFVKFIKLCAGRTGQLLNLSSLANESGISQPTAKSWLSVLQASYIVFLLQPYFKNFNKRVVKTPKLYFYDTGLASYLLGIQEKNQLINHYMRGELFENMIIAERMKNILNAGMEPQLFFWRDNTGNEIDLLQIQGGEIIATEIKSGATYKTEMFKGIMFWEGLTNDKSKIHSVVYGGNDSLATKHGKLISWKAWE